jgi:transposase
VNVLSDEKKQQVLALGRLDWPLRRIEEATGVRRETASGYLKAAGIAVRAPRTRRPPNPASGPGVSTDPVCEPGSNPASGPGVSTDSVGEPASNPASPAGVSTDLAAEPSRAPAASACEPYREQIELAVDRGRNARAIWQDLVTDHGFAAGYASVKRFVAKQRGSRRPEERVRIETAPGHEAQVDYGDGPMVRHPETGKYRRTRLFVFTLGCSRKSVRLLVFKSSSRTWCELHEEAFRRLGGTTKIVVLDNLKEGVLTPDIYDPRINPLYRDMLAHYGAVALPCRVRDPDRKGKVESGVGHAKRTPLKGLRFERLELAQAYLDRWEENWADTRIHGTTKRQVAAMFAEERPHLTTLPIEPFRYYEYGTRIVHLDGCVEVDAAYYHAPPGWIGRTVAVQWDGLRVRLLDPQTGQLQREYLVQRRGGRRVLPEDRPAKTPATTLELLATASRAGRHVGALCDEMHRREQEGSVRKLLGMRALLKKHGSAAVDEACSALLELGIADYRPVRRYLERRPAAPVSLAQIDPLIRSLAEYRDHITHRLEGETP